MEINHIDALAVMAKEQRIDAWEVKSFYCGLIEELCNLNWYKMKNEVCFIEDCYRKIDYAIRSYDPNKGSFDKRVRALLNQSVREYCGRRGRGNIDNKEVFSIYERELTVEEQALDSVVKEELMSAIGKNEMDRLLLSIIFESEKLVSQNEVSKRLAAATGRTYNSARGVVRAFIKRWKVQYI